MRGKQCALFLWGCVSGLIPACAGKTRDGDLRCSHPWAHPRVCGENRSVPALDQARRGSSPRVRGKRSLARHASVSPRLIPACAGKTYRFGAARPWPEAHPRVCGENPLKATHRHTAMGSSPRVRGKRVEVRDRLKRRGLIPACAGKTLIDASRLPHAPAHPRVCGENAVPNRANRRGEGSSPRVRGKRRRRIR